MQFYNLTHTCQGLTDKNTQIYLSVAYSVRKERRTTKMAQPKKKQSIRRRRLRRAHQKIDVPNLSACSNCGKPIHSHHVCPYCGFYNGELVVAQKVKRQKKVDA